MPKPLVVKVYPASCKPSEINGPTKVQEYKFYFFGNKETEEYTRASSYIQSNPTITPKQYEYGPDDARLRRILINFNPRDNRNFEDGSYDIECIDMEDGKYEYAIKISKDITRENSQYMKLAAEVNYEEIGRNGGGNGGDGGNVGFIVKTDENSTINFENFNSHSYMLSNGGASGGGHGQYAGYYIHNDPTNKIDNHRLAVTNLGFNGSYNGQNLNENTDHNDEDSLVEVIIRHSSSQAGSNGLLGNSSKFVGKGSYTDNAGDSDDRSSWGRKIKYQLGDKEIVNYVDDTGKTSAKVTENDIIWLKEESDGTSAWYGLDNSNGTFELGSRFWVRWLDEERNGDEWRLYYDKLDAEHKVITEQNKLWIFLVGVTDPYGNEYVTFKDNADVPLYIQLGSDWDKDDINAIFISESTDEKVDVTYQFMDFPEGYGEFAKVILKHFSPYAIFDPVNEVAPEQNTNDGSDTDKEKTNPETTNDESDATKTSADNESASAKTFVDNGSANTKTSVETLKYLNSLILIFLIISSILWLHRKKLEF